MQHSKKAWAKLLKGAITWSFNHSSFIIVTESKVFNIVKHILKKPGLSAHVITLNSDVKSLLQAFPIVCPSSNQQHLPFWHGELKSAKPVPCCLPWNTETMSTQCQDCAFKQLCENSSWNLPLKVKNSPWVPCTAHCVHNSFNCTIKATQTREHLQKLSQAVVDHQEAHAKMKLHMAKITNFQLQQSLPALGLHKCLAFAKGFRYSEGANAGGAISFRDKLVLPDCGMV